MESIMQLMQGFTVALQPMNIMWVTIGGVLGTIIGMLPGLGPATGVAVLLPLTFSMGPVAALITMGGVYYGAMYGGSRASILLNTPGDGAAVAATFDGYPMTQQGRAEAALAISAIASFIGGVIATGFMVLVSVPVARFAIRFGAAEYFQLYVFALAATASMSKGNRIKGFMAMIIGLMIATIGIDAQSGVKRFTFGILELQSGIDFLIVIIAIFALGEVFKSFQNIKEGKTHVQKDFGRIWISREDWKRCVIPILRSSPLGFFIGALPGAGGTMASLMAYNNERQMSKHPDEFGKGAIEGLAAPEAANNAASVGAMIPMLTLGIPGSGTTAVMMGALMILGMKPGPLLFQQQPVIIWGLIASMFIGNIILAIVNIPLAGGLVRVLSVPPKILYPIVLGLSFVGAYAISYSVMDFYILLVFGVLGYIMGKAKIPTSPLILAVIVGNNMEQSFRRAFTISDGSMQIFFNSPISIVLFALTIISICFPMGKAVFIKMRERRQAFA
ncbi:MAG: tripartite tricarboxylate transporter permease [Spirochaetia bacterium]|nr:tripartite tricarboxylate transporter permease [Spirochaetia bacterium]